MPDYLALTGKWRDARHRAKLHELKERYSEVEMRGEPWAVQVPGMTFEPYPNRESDGC